MWKLLKHKKEKTMENYEVKGVTQASEIRNAYEEAIKLNAKYYRAISKTNIIYGWDVNAIKPDGTKGMHVKAVAGQEWFENPHYVEEETVEPIEQMVEVANELVEEVKAEETVQEVVEKIDYKALYEEKCAEVDNLKEDLENAKKYAEYCKAENKELKDGLSAFKNLLNKF